MSRLRFLGRHPRLNGDLVSVLPDRRPKAVQLRNWQQRALLAGLGFALLLALGLTLFKLLEVLLWAAVASVR